MSKILFTAFEPFGEFLFNPSIDVAQALTERFPTSTFALLPVSNFRLAPVLDKLMSDNNYQYIFSFGFASNASKIKVEKIAMNIRHYRIPDNDNQQIFNNPIIPGHNLALQTTFNVDEAISNLDSDIIELSYFAGTYLCNQAYYQFLFQNPSSLFIHIPKTNTPSGQFESQVLDYTLVVDTIEMLIRELISSRA
jgi:pyroglutamyl-peptidase